jgi:hypothetical protein
MVILFLRRRSLVGLSLPRSGVLVFLGWYSLKLAVLTDVCGLLQSLNGKVGGVGLSLLLLRNGGVQLKQQFVPMPDRGKGTIYGTLIALLCGAWNSSSRLLGTRFGDWLKCKQGS